MSLPVRLDAITAVVRRPRLWATGFRQMRRLAAPGWWHRWPFLPVPPPAYLRFRLQTAYGHQRTTIAPDDLVTYLHWCRTFPKGTLNRTGPYSRF